MKGDVLTLTCIKNGDYTEFNRTYSANWFAECEEDTI